MPRRLAHQVAIECGDLAAVIVAERPPGDPFVQFVAFDIVDHRPGGGPLLRLRGGQHRDDVTDDLTAAEPIFAGGIDADGCASLRLVAGGGEVHLCDADDVVRLGRLIERTVAIAKGLCDMEALQVVH